jgi:hypothetical protein
MRENVTPREISQLISVLEKPDELIDFYSASLAKNSLLHRLDKALACRRFEDNDGNIEHLGKEAITAFQVALIYFLANSLRPAVTVETGFGLGVSSLAFLASGAEYDHKKHIAIDPYGLSGRGSIILNHISQLPNNRFLVLREPSEYALPRLVSNRDLVDCYVSLIDGSHLFEIVMADFTYLDRVTPRGGCIIFDDVKAPAIETVINFIRSNKRNYHVVQPDQNTVVLIKLTAPDGRKWYHFRPFVVPDRADWTPPHMTETADASATTYRRI